jgi:hypothetical protein
VCLKKTRLNGNMEAINSGFGWSLQPSTRMISSLAADVTLDPHKYKPLIHETKHHGWHNDANVEGRILEICCVQFGYGADTNALFRRSGSRTSLWLVTLFVMKCFSGTHEIYNFLVKDLFLIWQLCMQELRLDPPDVFWNGLCFT